MSFNYNKIKELSTEKHVPFNALAEKIGMSRAGFYRTIENKTLSVSVLEKIAEALEEPITSFFDVETEESKAVKGLKADIEFLDLQVYELNERIQEYRSNVLFYRREIKDLIKSLLNYINDNRVEATSIAKNDQSFYMSLIHIMLLTKNTEIINEESIKVVADIISDIYKQKGKE